MLLDYMSVNRLKTRVLKGGRLERDKGDELNLTDGRASSISKE